ncbi:hypothetical protein PPYR_12512 [Photinus pyralis]|uniref:Uncharacterized protein n=1 Tax=Photinus pyralis TaxID=7054 RepID=A0A1Y1KWV0_PHOPY|nr:uncharacterized protein LOC116177884 [Photinus pyralis]KAB0792892.1 hypothetical protein PPYR_12512 [Photinus pyralis]
MVPSYDMHSSVLLPIIVVAFFRHLPGTDGIKCFQCNSTENEECLTLSTTDLDSPFYQECEPTNDAVKPFCKKTKYFMNYPYSIFRITRECGRVFFKDDDEGCKYADVLKAEKVCQCFSDGCNTSANTTGDRYRAVLLASFLFLLL